VDDATHQLHQEAPRLGVLDLFFLAAGTGQKSFTGKKIVSGLSGQNSQLRNILDLALITLPLSLSVDSHLSLLLCLSVFVVLLHTYVHFCSSYWI
jgi:hypothetical protein